LAALTKTVSRGIRGAIFVAVPATAGLFLVARPLVSAIFEQGRFTSADTPSVALTLVFYALGLSGYFMQQITTRAFYSMQDPRTPCRSAILAVCANVVLNLVLIWPLGTGGLAVATAACSYLQVAVMSHALHRRLGGSVMEGALATLAKTLLATVIMAAAGIGVLLLMRQWPQSRLANVGRVAVIVPLAATVYWAVARVLRIESLRLLSGARAKG
jgi:putative peptidoglycan lipid II flippase